MLICFYCILHVPSQQGLLHSKLVILSYSLALTGFKYLLRLKSVEICHFIKMHISS